MNDIFGLLIAQVALAAGFGWVDTQFGFFQKLYMWCYNLITPPDKNLSKKDNKSFVRGQTSKGKFRSAVILGLVLGLLMLASPGETPLYIESILLFAGIFALFFGFLLTPIFGALINLGGFALNKADELETGESDMLDVVNDIVGNDDIDSTDTDVSSKSPESTAPPAPLESEQPDPIVEVESQDSIDDEGISDEEALAKLNKFKERG